MLSITRDECHGDADYEEHRMKAFLVKYEWAPSCEEASVVLAENKDRARALCCDLSPIESIEEIPMDKEALVYTGYFCC